MTTNGKHRFGMDMSPETIDQIDQLRGLYPTSRASIVRQAVSKWYHSEKHLMKKAPKKRQVSDLLAAARRTR